MMVGSRKRQLSPSFTTDSILSPSFNPDLPPSKRPRCDVASSTATASTLTEVPSHHDRLSHLPTEIQIRILHHLPLQTVLLCQTLSTHFARLSTDPQIWKSLYYTRFVRPRALRLPNLQEGDLPGFSSRQSKWLEETGLGRGDVLGVNWKARFKLRHNWRRGRVKIKALEIEDEATMDEDALPEDGEESPIRKGEANNTPKKDGSRTAGVLVRLVDGMAVTADKDAGLRAWDLKSGNCIARSALPSTEKDGGKDTTPTCLAVATEGKEVTVVVGFDDGVFGFWKLRDEKFEHWCWQRDSSGSRLSAVAYSHPYSLVISEDQTLSLYVFDNKATVDLPRSNDPPTTPDADDKEGHSLDYRIPQMAELSDKVTPPRRLTRLTSQTSWPPLSLSLRTSPHGIIAAVAFSLPTYTAGWSVGLQELHLDLEGNVTVSRLSSATPQGFHSLVGASSPSSSPPSPSSSLPYPPSLPTAAYGVGGRIINNRPTSLSYSHPYLLAGNSDNTLTLYLVTSSVETLDISKGTRLFGHTSSILDLQIGARGKAVSVSGNGDEIRVWELEGGKMGLAGSVLVTGEGHVVGKERAELGLQGWGSINRRNRSVTAGKGWVGFDDEVVVLLKGSDEDPMRRDGEKLVVYDFT